MKILIADDERITLRNLERRLKGWGHEVVAAEDGVAALEQFEKQRFDIVVTDWDMPRMDGRELIRRIRGSAASSYTYLIMLTGRSETSDLVDGMEAGADDFLAKPFDRNELRVRLNSGKRVIDLERKLAAQNQTLSKANERMTRDLNAAAQMQRDLLPKDLPDGLGARFAWYFEPCDELGGDILNVLPLDEHNVALYLLDVAGHGVPAALLSVTLSQVLTTRDPRSSIIVTADRDGQTVATPPGEVAARLNRKFPMEAQGERFTVMAYAVLDTQSRLLRYTNMGLPHPILFRQGCPPETLGVSSRPIGIFEDTEFEETSVQLEPGDRLYVFSDGVTEAMNERDEMLDTEGLIELIETTRTSSLEDDLEACVVELKRWTGTVPFSDDVSILALELPA